QCIGVRLRQGEHVLFENLPCKRSGMIENRPVKILVETNLASLERRNHHFVPVGELFLVQVELTKSSFSLFAVPGIVQKHAAHIPKNCTDTRQEDPPRLAFTEVS